MELKRKVAVDRNRMCNNNIPNDIVIEILLRLPAKSLVQLRWACKYWFDLISSSGFVKMHLQCHSSIHDEIFFSPSVLISSYRTADCNRIFQCYLNYNINTTRGVEEGRDDHLSNHDEVVISIIHVPLEYPIERRHRCPQILGSCNGLILMFYHRLRDQRLCIWNPCTKEYRFLPHPLLLVHNNNSDMYSHGGNNYGFGYDRITDDYKVIRNTYYYVGEDYDLRSDVQVYTLGTNSWRRISRSNHPYGWLTNGVFLNNGGALYWMNTLHQNIFSFDIEKEKFQHVSKTPNVGDHQAHVWRDVKLQVLFEGSLCVVLKMKEKQNYRTEMWVMNNNNNNNNETKLSTIPKLHDFRFDIKPLRYTRNGEILMLKNQNEVILYDPENNNKDRILGRICEDPNHHLLVKEVYSESLVSLNSGTYTGQEQTKNKKMRRWR